jgi:hypothetical protein
MQPSTRDDVSFVILGINKLAIINGELLESIDNHQEKENKRQNDREWPITV